jgi:hypothetical protein
MSDELEFELVVLREAIIDSLMTGDFPLDAALAYTGEAEGAFPNRTRVRKSSYEEGDTFDTGTRGTVIGSIGPTDGSTPGLEPGEYMYVVLWDPFPELPVFIRGRKIEVES